MTRKPAAPWYKSLTDSVYALGAAAREARSALRTAQLAGFHWDLQRIRPVDGVMARPGAIGQTISGRPHDDVLFRIGRAFLDAEHALSNLYDAAALNYADGAVWAIARVQAGEQPPAVDCLRGEHGLYVPGPRSAITPLTRWNRWADYERAHTRLLRHENAASHAEDLAAAEYLSDHEAGDYHDALDVARGLADAALDFGNLAETGLHFALLPIRNR